MNPLAIIIFLLPLPFLAWLFITVLNGNVRGQRSSSILLAIVCLLVELCYIVAILTPVRLLLVIAFYKATWPWMHLGMLFALALISLIKFRKNIAGYLALALAVFLFAYFIYSNHSIKQELDNNFGGDQVMQDVM